MIAYNAVIRLTESAPHHRMQEVPASRQKPRHVRHMIHAVVTRVITCTSLIQNVLGTWREQCGRHCLIAEV